jgi:biotin synthase
VLDMVREVKALGLEACCTLGMLKDGQAEQLRDAGLDYYNHNLDTAPEHYGEIITTRDYQDRLDTLERVRGAGISVCCGGIVGLGESRRERAGLLAANSIFYGDKLLTTGNPDVERDNALFAALGIANA